MFQIPITFLFSCGSFVVLFSYSVMSDSVRLYRRHPTRLPCPWDSPGKNTGVGCHFLLQCMKVKSESEVTQSCPTVSDPMDCSPLGSSFHGIFQTGVLECLGTYNSCLTNIPATICCSFQSVCLTVARCLFPQTKLLE